MCVNKISSDSEWMGQWLIHNEAKQVLHNGLHTSFSSGLVEEYIVLP